jgi:hypothetical protein
MAKRLGLEKVLFDSFIIDRIYSSKEANKLLFNSGYTNTPYAPDTIVLDVILKHDITFIRVYNNQKNIQGQFITIAKEIEGLTAKQIQEKFALPYIPKYKAIATFGSGSKLRLGITNKNYGFGGGGLQFDLKGEWVGNFEELGELK